jgi:hypothetical protein
VHLFSIPNWCFPAFALGLAILAFAIGGWRERMIATIVAIGWSIGIAAMLGAPSPLWMRLGWDIIILAACVFAARRSHRYWPLWASSFALLEVVTYALKSFRGVGYWAYLSMQRVWLILLFASLIAGLWSSARERRAAIAAS